MTHREFKLIVKNDIIVHGTGLIGFTPVRFKAGDVMMVDEDTFLRLQSGSFVQRYTDVGAITFDKYDFENEVAVTEVTVEYTVRRLGQRKNK